MRCADAPRCTESSPACAALLLLLLCRPALRLCIAHLCAACTSQDAFPRGIAQQNRFQRRVTLLSYLNDVPQVKGSTVAAVLLGSARERLAAWVHEHRLLLARLLRLAAARATPALC